MASKKDYFSFDEVLSDLEMEEDELKRLVSAGEIRAFRDKDSMKFKADDVNRLRGTSDSEVEEIDLGEDLALDDEPAADEVVVEEVEEIDLTADDDKPVRPRRAAAAAGAAPRARGARASAAMAAQTDEQSEGLGMRALLIVLALLMIVGSVVTLDAAAGRSSNGISGFVANLFKS